MSTNQLHGKEFENLILSALGYSQLSGARATDIFDIPLVITSKRAGSLKLSKRGSDIMATTVHLSDACRVWNWRALIELQALSSSGVMPVIQLLMGVYDQEGPVKVVHSIYELPLVLNPETMKKLYGSVTLDEVFAFHQGLRVEFHPHHEDARLWATAVLENLSPRLGCIKLNRKIDSKGQRRLQCTASLKDIWDASTGPQLYQDTFYGIELPIRILSSEREFGANESVKQLS